jgi:NADH dehydrogenase (ubiquinone) Fe-S protein 6
LFILKKEHWNKTMLSRVAAAVVGSPSWPKHSRNIWIHHDKFNYICGNSGHRAAEVVVRGFGTAPPPSVPARSPYNIEPSTVDKSKEEMRVHTRTYHESEYKLGKHRSNALELIERIPVIEVEGEFAICDGGGGPLGHPLEYISLQRPGVVERCKYCGLRFACKAWAKGH